MKKLSLFALVLVILPTMAWAQEPTLTQNVGGYFIGMALDRLPALVGDNTAIFRIKDSSGKAMTGSTATVEVLYFMREAPMPGKDRVRMPYMAYIAEAVPKDSMYVAKLNLWMGGTWNMFVTVTDGGTSVTGRFHLHVEDKSGLFTQA